ncbi:hypothetical protein DICVIV_04588 [Dictyocaulus viviparus]|uniref:Uncharacterized protein n=1 Tax=Dictyocaulus viviparus TaxID=29172 RepID=A0A0D8Y3Y3_DICVI|nr:hypothetical protein DICVIV_04588 [Dictyocaulus viviparus]
MQRVSTAPSLLIQTHPLLQKPAIHLATPTLQKAHSRRVSSSVDVTTSQQKLFHIKKSSSDVISTHKIAPTKASEEVEVEASTCAENTMTSSTSQESPSPNVQASTSENGLQVDITESANTSKTSSSLLTPPSEDDQDSKSSPAHSICGTVAKKRKSNGVRKNEEAVRKSGRSTYVPTNKVVCRITRTCDPSTAEFVDNYVDSKRLKQPRIVQPPKGGVRIPNMVPRNKSAKEKDKLSIDMVGPRTRSSLAEPISPLGGSRRRNTNVELTAKIGPDHQVI